MYLYRDSVLVLVNSIHFFVMMIAEDVDLLNNYDFGLIKAK